MNRLMDLYEALTHADREWIAGRLGLLPSQVSLTALAELEEQDRDDLADRIAERDPQWPDDPAFNLEGLEE